MEVYNALGSLWKDKPLSMLWARSTVIIIVVDHALYYEVTAGFTQSLGKFYFKQEKSPAALLEQERTFSTRVAR